MPHKGDYGGKKPTKEQRAKAKKSHKMKQSYWGKITGGRMV